jgi:histidinol-phosphate aminotransferase
MTAIEALVRPNILQLQAYSSARDEFSGQEGIFLDANENPYGTLNRYPDPHQRALKAKIAAIKETKPENVFIGNGSDEIFDLVFRIFCRPGQDKALTFSPTYGMYRVCAGVNQVELLQLPLDRSFQIDMEQTFSYLDSPDIKLIIICSPNNPTGNLIRRSDIIHILDHFKGMVLVDEAYIDFSGTGSMIHLIDTYDRLIVSQTCSKARGLASCRVGMAFSGNEVIALMNKVKLPYNVSGPNQKAVLEALEDSENYQQNLALLTKERERLKKRLEGMSVIKKVYPSRANFLLVEVEDADMLYRDLASRGIVTRNRSKQVSNCLRISVGTPAENDALTDALKNMS